MKRTREHTTKEPQAKRPKTFMEVLSTIGQNVLTELQNWWSPTVNQTLPSEHTADADIPLVEDLPVLTDRLPAQPDNPTIVVNSEEFPQVVDDHTNTVNEIDHDLEAAIAFSLMVNEEVEKKVEEDNVEKQGPYGHQEKAQKIIAELSAYWDRKLVSFYQKGSPRAHKDNIFVINQYIKSCIEQLAESCNEETFLNTIIDIGWAAVEVANMYGSLNARFYTHPNGISEEYAMLDKLFQEANFVEPFKKKMLKEFEETYTKIKRALYVLTSLKEKNEEQYKHLFIDMESCYGKLQVRESMMKNLKNKSEELATITKNLFETFYNVHNFKNNYPDLIQPFKDKVLAQEIKDRFFEANLAFFKLKLKNMLEPKLLADIIGLAVNQDSKVVQFSLPHFEQMQKSMQDIEKARKTNGPSGP